MTAMYDIAKEMVERGLLTVRTDENNPDIEVFCYSRDAFQNGNWNSITLTHRGAIYYKKQMVNKPFEKIFNIGEVEGVNHDTISRRMENEQFDVLHKSNGHLLICSHFYDENDESVFVWSTKGSLPNRGNDLLNEDIRLINEPDGLQHKVEALANDLGVPFTMMFEAIVQHDKHTLYEKDIERYSDMYPTENTFVLLGMNTFFGGSWKDEPFYYLEHLREEFGFTLVDHFDNMDSNIKSWYEHKDTEGYVIRFENGDRVKVKTKEYWAIRFKKDLRPENIIGKFRVAGYDRIENKLPEEISSQVVPLIAEWFESWLIEEWTNLDANDGRAWKHFSVTYEVVSSSKEIATDEELTEGQKEYIFHLLKDKPFSEYALKCSQSKTKRKLFCEWFNNNDAQKKRFADALTTIIDTIGE